MKRNVAILATALGLIVVLTVLILEDPPEATVNAAVDMRSDNIETLIQSAARSPFHRKRAERILRELVREGDRAVEDGELGRAAEVFASCARLAPDDPYVLRRLGLAQYRRGEYDEACAVFGKCLALRPNKMVSYTDLAIALVRADKEGDAEKVAIVGIANLPAAETGPLHFILSRIYERRHLPEQATEHLTRAVGHLDPEALEGLKAVWAATSATAVDAVAAERPAAAPSAVAPAAPVAP